MFVLVCSGGSGPHLLKRQSCRLFDTVKCSALFVATLCLQSSPFIYNMDTSREVKKINNHYEYVGSCSWVVLVKKILYVYCI